MNRTLGFLLALLAPTFGRPSFAEELGREHKGGQHQNVAERPRAPASGTLQIKVNGGGPAASGANPASRCSLPESRLSNAESGEDCGPASAGPESATTTGPGTCSTPLPSLSVAGD